MFKKIIFLLSFCSMIIFLSGCNTEKQTVNPENDNQPNEEIKVIQKTKKKAKKNSNKEYYYLKQIEENKE